MPFGLPSIQLLTAILSFGILILVVLLGRPLVNIGSEEVGLVERRYFGSGLPRAA